MTRSEYPVSHVFACRVILDFFIGGQSYIFSDSIYIFPQTEIFADSICYIVGEDTDTKPEERIMKKYSDEFKEQALEMLQAEGYTRTSEALKVHKETLYRWKRDAGIVLTNRKHKLSLEEDVASESVLNTDENKPLLDNTEDEDFFAEDTRLPRLFPRKDEVREEDFEILMAANEKLRRRNAYLRRVIDALLDS